MRRVLFNLIRNPFGLLWCQPWRDSVYYIHILKDFSVVSPLLTHSDSLKQTFTALHFNVVLHKWLSAADALSVLGEVFRRRENLAGDCFVCCIISRGTGNHLLGTDSYGAGLHLDDVRRLFNADACPVLAGKPKLFLIQRYDILEIPPRAGTQHRDEDLETDGCFGLSRCDLVPTDADVFWSHCWTGEQQLVRGDHRSVYLQVLRDALHKGQRR